MYKNILVPVLLDQDHPPEASYKAALAIADAGAAFTVMHVVEAIPGFVRAEVPQDLLDQNRQKAEAAVAEIAKGLPNARAVLVTGHAGRSITDYAAANGIDCIVVASHKPGLEDYFLGSTASRVVRHAPCAVHVIR